MLPGGNYYKAFAGKWMCITLHMLVRQKLHPLVLSENLGDILKINYMLRKNTFPNKSFIWLNLMRLEMTQKELWEEWGGECGRPASHGFFYKREIIHVSWRFVNSPAYHLILGERFPACLRVSGTLSQRTDLTRVLQLPPGFSKKTFFLLKGI